MDPTGNDSSAVNSYQDARDNGIVDYKVQELIGDEFEEYLTKSIGGKGSFSKGTEILMKELEIGGGRLNLGVLGFNNGQS